MAEWIEAEVAKDMLDDPDVEGSYFVLRVTTRYEPEQWQWDSIDERVAHYQQLGVLSHPIRVASREQAFRFILSFESALRQRGRVALPTRKDYWGRRNFSDRIPLRFKRTLVQHGLLSERRVQISKTPLVFDATQALQDQIPALPDGQREGRFVWDRPRQVVEVRNQGFLYNPDDLPPLVEEMNDLNAWLAANADRITGLDDLTFHRVFQGDVLNGGRLYGAFTSMDKDRERDAITIDGEATAEADLNGAGLSILLLLNGRDIPDDPYQEGELRRFGRNLVKTVLTRLFGRGEWWANRFPHDLHKAKATLGYPDRLPGYQEFKLAAVRTYPFLAEVRPRLTFMLERYESEALMRTLHWLRDQGEVGLPIHDGVRVKQSLCADTLEMFRTNRNRECQEMAFGGV